MNVLAAGGTGCLGSHTVVELQKAGHNPIIADNLYNAKADVIDRIEKITGKRPHPPGILPQQSWVPATEFL